MIVSVSNCTLNQIESDTILNYEAFDDFNDDETNSGDESHTWNRSSFL